METAEYEYDAAMKAAAEKIGANPLLARTGAYFHDIGKLKRPLYFKENQMGDNPHDRTDPYVSAAIVTAHTRDGLALAQKYHLKSRRLSWSITATPP